MNFYLNFVHQQHDVDLLSGVGREVASFCVRKDSVSKSVVQGMVLCLSSLAFKIAGCYMDWGRFVEDTWKLKRLQHVRRVNTYPGKKDNSTRLKKV